MRLLSIILLGIFLIGCGDASLTVDAPETGGAIPPMASKERRIAIVYSETSANQYYDLFIYNQTFASMQQLARQAGLPYDLLNEQDMTNVGLLATYDAIVIPSFNHVRRADRDSIIAALAAAQTTGTGIIASGDFLSGDEQGGSFDDWDSATQQLMGLTGGVYIDGRSTRINISNSSHPITEGYARNEEIANYSQAWYADYQPIEGSNFAQIASAVSDGQNYTGVIATDNTARVVHFAIDELMSGNLLWPALQWVVYGDRAPVALQLSRSDSIAVARNDMDQTMFPALLDTIHVPLLDVLKDWKRDYNFTGSHYIDIGNDPQNGKFTDWNVSAPLLQQYIDLGIEIGTHSWTHPYFTGNLTDSQLEFEFNQSKNEISTQLNIPVTGGAIPGNTETPHVVDILDQWFEYFSGKANPFSLTQPAAIGFLRPDHNLIYFSLNTSPDFTLSDYLNYPPDVAEQVWREEIDQILTPHAQQPVVHWLWHDYAPTTGIADGTYTREMFDNTVAYMYQQGVEFATLDDIQNRIRSFAATEFTVGVANTVDTTVVGSNLGQFSLQLADGALIKNVANWYAYSADKVFLPQNGGQFSITSGNTPDPVTRISALPMRAKLLNVTGDGTVLSFDISGSGEVTVTLNPQLLDNYVVSGADSVVEHQDQLLLSFNADSTHSVSIEMNVTPNIAPIAVDQLIDTSSDQPVNVTLVATDADNQSLSYNIDEAPQSGVITGTAPNVTYTPDSAFTGSDSFTFNANDGTDTSNLATVTINVSNVPIPNRPPIADALSLQTLMDNPVNIILSGSDNENQTLTYRLLTLPANGDLTGTAPSLAYTPASGFIGTDQFLFTVSDGVNDSNVATVSINVVSELPPSNGTLSNPVANSSLAVDGNLADWTGVRPFGTDPDDANGNRDLIDWSEAWFAHDDDNFYVAYQTYDISNLTWGHGVYLDTDTSTETGFRGYLGELAIGADYLLEGQSLFKYGENGDGTSWSWEFVSSVAGANSANISEFAIPRTDLDNPLNIGLALRGNSLATGGTTLDDYPDGLADAQVVDAQRHFSYSINANEPNGNIAPTANSMSLDIGTNMSVSLLLTGDDLNGDALTYTIESGPANGTLSGVAPAIGYTPNDNFTGTDLLTFSVSDGFLQSNLATVEINIVSSPPLNAAPVANAQTLAVLNTSQLPVILTGSDANADELTFEVIDQPQNGSLSGSAPNLSYSPTADFNGIDTFRFQVSDGTLTSSPATIRINVNNSVENSAPVANSATMVTSFETAIATTLTASDADNHPLSYRIVAHPQLGALSGTPPALSYLPFNGASGNDSFTFLVNDGSLDSNLATVTISVLPENESNRAPVAIGLNLAGEQNQPIAMTLAGRDPEGADLSFELVSQPQSGSLSGTAPQLTYTPNIDSSGLDSFSFLVNDGQLTSNPINVTIDIDGQVGSPISNPVSSIRIDGDITDWHGLSSTGIDADDVFGPENPLDMRASWISHDDSNYYLALRNDGPFLLSWGTQWLIDTDGNTSTGFSGFSGENPVGADYLIEGASVHRHTGSGTSWSWDYLGAISVAIAGDLMEVSVPRSMFADASELQLFMIANNAAFSGSAYDYFPQAALDNAAPIAARRISYNADANPPAP